MRDAIRSTARQVGRWVWFWITHAVPRIHWTTYGVGAQLPGGGHLRLIIWRQWGRRTWAVADVQVIGRAMEGEEQADRRLFNQ